MNRTYDMDAISNILNHPRVRGITSDSSCVGEYVPCETDFYIMNEEKTGIIKIDPMNGASCSVHIATLPVLWGKAVAFAKEGINWGFSHTTYMKIIAMVPDYNKMALAFCRRCGFEVEGRIRESFLKDWKLHDQVLFGLTKSDFYKGGHYGFDSSRG